VFIKRVLFTFLCVLILSIGVAQAEGVQNCYLPDEFEAEQGLKIHSELMVIGLTCQKVRGMSNVYNKYRQFTTKNRYLITQYENTLLRHYRSNGQDPDKSLHFLRTSMANDISQKAIRMNMGAFCRHYGGRIDQALGMEHETLRQWAKQKWPSQPTSKPLCRQFY
tara:strand:+ start:761 stop:1255 length:495 start_codon:yes stop_codon:yes gene_type:complete